MAGSSATAGASSARGDAGGGFSVADAATADEEEDEEVEYPSATRCLTEPREGVALIGGRHELVGELAVPRVRDFRGLPNRSFDGRGSYTFGIKEQLIFPEVDYDKVEKIHGMDITIVTTTRRDDLAMGLLRELGWPFRGETPQAVVAR